MFEELNPAAPGETPDQIIRRNVRFQSASPLRLASEYEAAFGRQKLDLLISTLNPDADHQPGRLHRLLFELPWADVLTTNYDTLLERTDIPGRTYQPVTKIAQLTTAFFPRIIKLHGSLPSRNILRLKAVNRASRGTLGQRRMDPRRVLEFVLSSPEMVGSQ